MQFKTAVSVNKYMSWSLNIYVYKMMLKSMLKILCYFASVLQHSQQFFKHTH